MDQIDLVTEQVFRDCGRGGIGFPPALLQSPEGIARGVCLPALAFSFEVLRPMLGEKSRSVFASR